MPRPKRTEERTRLNLDLTERVRDRLERLRDETEADSLTEVIRRALHVYDVMVHGAKNGTIILRKPNGEEIQLLLI